MRYRPIAHFPITKADVAYSRHVEEVARPPEAGAKREPAAKKLKHKTAD